MRYEYFVLISLFAFTNINLMGQTIATNILFEEAHSVIKGKVLSIRAVWEDDEKTEFIIDVAADDYYKGVHYDKGAIFKLKTTRPVILDMTTNERVVEKVFQVKVGADYIFFIEQPNPESRSEEVLFADMTDIYIEGIPYSAAFAKSIEHFDKTSWIEANHQGNIAVKLLAQGSDLITIASVSQIKARDTNMNYEITLTTQKGDLIFLQTYDLHCISAEGKLQVNQNYLFFLNEIDKGRHILADRWLGILDVNSMTKSILSLSKR